MPLVKTEKRYAAGKEFTIRYNMRKDERVYAKLPPWVTDVIGAEEVAGDTINECRQKFHEKIEECELANTTTKKVIIYDFRVAAMIPNEGITDAQLKMWHQDHFHESVRDLDFDDIWAFHSRHIGRDAVGGELSFNEGGGISLFAQVFEETKIAYPDEKNRFKYTWIRSSIPETLGMSHGTIDPSNQSFAKDRNNQIIDWTPEAEEFFANIGTQLNRLIFGLVTYLQKPADEVQRIAETTNFAAITSSPIRRISN